MQHPTIPRVLLALAAVLMLLPMIPLAEAGHSVKITSGAANAGSYTMRVEVDSFKLVPVGSTGTNTKGEGHIHYLINGSPAKGDYATTSTSFTFTDLKDGDVIGVELVNNDHSSTDPQARSELTVGANEAPGLNMAVLAVGTVAVIGLVAVVGRRHH